MDEVAKIKSLNSKSNYNLKNALYYDIDSDIADAMLDRDTRLLFILRKVRTFLIPNKLYIKEPPEDTKDIPENTEDIKKTTSTQKSPENTEDIKGTTKRDDKIKKRALKQILETLPFSIYEECISKERSKDFFMKKETLVKKIAETSELKNLFPKGKNISTLSKDIICKQIFKN
jgi:hypothetical protein